MNKNRHEDDGLGPYWNIRLRVSGTDLVPDIITQQLGIEPTISHQKGDPRISPKGQFVNYYNLGLWGYKHDTKNDETIEEGIWAVLRQLEGKEEAMRNFEKLGYKKDFFIGLHFSEGINFGIEFRPQTLSKLGEFGLIIGFDIYS